MLAIELRFPGGRYHATPWDAHVNEGLVEWPPSPWRLLRALVATYHWKARDHVQEEDLRALVDRLAGQFPSYSMPAQVAGFHTRHYMRLFADKTTRVFDTFLHVPDGARVVAAWPGVALGPRLEGVLSDLLRLLGYLGRAESWVDAALCSEVPGALECHPVTPGEEAGNRAEVEVVRVLAPLAPRDFERWRATALAERLSRAVAEKEQKALAKGKGAGAARISPKERAALEGALPASVYDALLREPGTLRKEGWSRPPGSRWVEYVRPRPRPGRAAGVSGHREARRLPTVARFALAGAVLPCLTDAVLEAEKIRTVLLKHSDGAPVFSGRDPSTGRLLSGHEHAFVLPEANGRQGWITHVTIVARMGFDSRARDALERLRVVWQRSGHDLQLVLLGLGQPEDFGGTRVEAGQSPLLATATEWVSRTPFVPTRHEKRTRGGDAKRDADGLTVGSAEHDLIRLLREHGHPPPNRVASAPWTVLGGKPTRWLAFRTERRMGGGRRGGGLAGGFSVRFPHPVMGPIAVGYGAHFGLGTFVPDSGGAG